MDAGLIVCLIFFIVAIGGATALICYAKYCEKLVEPLLTELKEYETLFESRILHFYNILDTAQHWGEIRSASSSTY